MVWQCGRKAPVTPWREIGLWRCQKLVIQLRSLRMEEFLHSAISLSLLDWIFDSVPCWVWSLLGPWVLTLTLWSRSPGLPRGAFYALGLNIWGYPHYSHTALKAWMPKGKSVHFEGQNVEECKGAGRNFLMTPRHYTSAWPSSFSCVQNNSICRRYGGQSKLDVSADTPLVK